MGVDHSHGDGSGHHGGARDAVVWQVLDTIVFAVVMCIGWILFDLAYQTWRQRREDAVRYDLTPEGRAAADGTYVGGVAPDVGPLVDVDQLDKLG